MPTSKFDSQQVCIHDCLLFNTLSISVTIPFKFKNTGTSLELSYKIVQIVESSLFFIRMLKFFYIRQLPSWICMHRRYYHCQCLSYLHKLLSYCCLTHVNIVHSHIVIYALFVDDYIGKPWVFIMEPQRQHELEVSITLIAPVN